MVSRRFVLALGAAALLTGCAPEDSGRSDGGHVLARPSPSVSMSPAWQPPPANPPVAGVCPTVPGIVDKPGAPQHYLPCHGTDIALTIDDGPDAEWTPQVLDLLERLAVKATFCMIGKKAAANPGIVRAVIDGGHHIANHTFTHPENLHKLPDPQVKDEIGKAMDAITAASGGHRPTLFRSPGGAWSPTVLQECAAQAVRPLDWSVDPRDWSRPGVQHIATTILTHTHPGSIILEHDGGGNRAQTIQALRLALPRLLDAGYHFVQP
jgi:peptidoglycan/xylan/chitin deacetylase (PgdA/CDA1 family)